MKKLKLNLKLHLCQAITLGRYTKKGKTICGICNKEIK